MANKKMDRAKLAEQLADIVESGIMSPTGAVASVPDPELAKLVDRELERRDLVRRIERWVATMPR